MFITRELEYAIRIIRALAGGERMSAKEICAAEHVPVPFAYKILKKLDTQRLVNGFQGVQGGYQLAKPLDQIALYDVYLAVEGNLYINECLQQGYQCPNNPSGDACHVHQELKQMQDLFVKKLQEKSMAAIIGY